jgi:catechol 2,3-dioxygenase-like lactoylglutathione lyase family enzyme
MSASDGSAPGPVRLDHGALVVADEQQAREFYVDALGLTEVPRPPNFDFPGLWVAIGDQQIHIIGEAEAGRARVLHPGFSGDELARGYVTTWPSRCRTSPPTSRICASAGSSWSAGPATAATACSRPTWPTPTAT